MDECIFCKIVKGEIPSTKVYEDEYVLAFKDLNPVAPMHVLVIPKTHIASAGEIDPENSTLVASVFETIPKIAADLGIKDGFRVITNCGPSAGQTVFHLHFHLLGGRELGIMG